MIPTLVRVADDASRWFHDVEGHGSDTIGLVVFPHGIVPERPVHLVGLIPLPIRVALPGYS